MFHTPPKLRPICLLKSCYNRVMLVADICIFRGVSQLYSYIITDPNTYCIGQCVSIPFGRYPVKGVIFNIRPATQTDNISKLKSILAPIETAFIINQEYIDLICWFATYYQTTLHKAYQTIIGNRKSRAPLSLNNFTLSPSPFTLNQHQQAAFDTIVKETTFSKHLIHGITGSGKTEIYMRLAQHCIKQGQQIIICCPEISLTPQFKAQFTERFNDHVVVIHSGLTAKKRDECWASLQHKSASIVIGPRSAIFAPVQRLGMIVIDEEHDGSYKQDNHPRYLSHEIAKWRCQYHNCPLVLGSATPSVTSFLAAKNSAIAKNSSYNVLSKRATGSSLPTVSTIDMTQHGQAGQLLSTPLQTAIVETLKKNQKVLLLLNRRGFAPYVACQSCKTIHSCDQCGLSYTYHKDKTFRCHRCDITIAFSHQCKKCKKPHLAFSGQGIQKIEIELAQQFPQAHVIRLDKDTAKTATQMEKQLNTFKKEGNILLGTQLIAKGHHIEDISLVGVLGIDTQLNIPDFRSAERSFQLLMQVAGRAGRGKYEGHVYIQTTQPNHYAIRCAQTHDYERFIHQESEFRQQLKYPPFGELTYIILSCTDEKMLKNYCKRCSTYIGKHSLEEHVSILGPKPAPIEKIRDHYRWTILIKHSLNDRQAVKQWILDFPKRPADIRLICDFSPLQLL